MNRSKLPPFVFLMVITCAAAGQNPLSPPNTTHAYIHTWAECDCPHARFQTVLVHTDSGWHRTDYFVHGPTVKMDGWFEDSAARIPNGRFIYTYPDSKIDSTGRYIHGKKDGLWMAWHYNGMLANSTVYETGNPIGTSLGFYPSGRIKDSVFYRPDGSSVRYIWYNNGSLASAGILAPDGKKTGRWKYWHDNGKFAAVELYDHDSLLEHQYFDENGLPSDTARKDRLAAFNGGSQAWLKWLSNNVIWPENYIITGADTAVVVFSVTVDESGKLTDVYVSSSAFPEFEKVALRAFRRSPKWEPAISHNRRVPDHFKQPVTFTQQPASMARKPLP